MSKKAVEKLFNALYRLTDLRQIFRETSPNHNLTEEQEKKAEDILEDVRKDLEILEEEMLE